MLQPYLSLILPAYNESQRIRSTVDAAVDYFKRRALSYEIIVAADGDDGTREIVAGLARSRPALSVLGTSQRCGKGRGIREAVARATGHFIGFADADDKTPITEFDIIRPHLEGGCDVVIGSRGMAESKVEKKQKLYRRLGSTGFWLLLQMVMPLHGIRDTQCGFKFFQHGVAKDLFARQRIDGYMFDVEILYLARCSGYSIEQVPVRWRDDNDSRLNLIAGNARNLIDVFRIRLGSYPPPETCMAAPCQTLAG
jgi:dolichyl-phosphate beta-glucosyltransferase